MTNEQCIYKTWNEHTNGKFILVVNCGSSSIKLSVFNQETYERFIDLNFTSINARQPILSIYSSKGKESIKYNAPFDIAEGIKIAFDILFQKFSFSSLAGIGHRFVHGGDQYRSTMLIDQSLILALERLSSLDPLHNHACLSGIKASLQNSVSHAFLVPQVVVFDTSFHSTLPPVAASYAIPRELALKHSIKRYGFHGISHAFLWQCYQEHVKGNSKNKKIITLHLGSGCSMTAIKDGKSIETSMGFTPNEGLVMATRSGDVDASIVEFISNKEQMTSEKVIELLNINSGLKGLSGVSSDMEELLNLYQEDENVRLAIDLFCYRVVKYIGAYIAVLEGVDALIFSGGIGENSSIIREKIINKMTWYGLKIAPQVNVESVGLLSGQIKEISTPTSSIPVYVIATDENLFIAGEVKRILQSV